MSPAQRKAFDRAVAKGLRPREQVETIMGVVYWSDDNWETVHKLNISGGGGSRQVKGKEADLARFLAVSQSSWQGNAS